jgi:hypothetical protein
VPLTLKISTLTNKNHVAILQILLSVPEHMGLHPGVITNNTGPITIYPKGQLVMITFLQVIR